MNENCIVIVSPTRRTKWSNFFFFGFVFAPSRDISRLCCHLEWSILLSQTTLSWMNRYTINYRRSTTKYGNLFRCVVYIRVVYLSFNEIIFFLVIFLLRQCIVLANRLLLINSFNISQYLHGVLTSYISCNGSDTDKRREL